jgi:hypothetical protein
MHPLDDLIAQWAAALEASEPALAPHLDEITDHVRADAEARVAAGAEPSQAFAAALGSFGAPRRSRQTSARRTALRVERRAVAAASIVLSLVLVAMVLVIDKLVRPVDPAWLAVAWVVIVLPSEGVIRHLLRWRERRAAGA